MKLPKEKQRVATLFDTVATGYGGAALRFFPFSADQLVNFLKPLPGEKVLDVATGTGNVATALAQMVTNQGRVTGIDISEGMLKQTQEKISRLGISNVDLHTMDAESLEFRSNYFHHATCAYGIFFLPDMVKGLKEWVRVVRPGGKIVFSCFGPTAFEPMAELFLERIGNFGVEPPNPDRPFGAKRTADPKQCRGLLQEAGLERPQVMTKPLGYYLSDSQEWWEIVWNAGFRGFVDQLSAQEQARFRQEHLDEVAQLADDKGIWLDVETHFCMGYKPD